MNRGELRTLVLSYLDDPDGGYFTTSQVNVWLNLAQNEVQKRLIKASENYYLECIQTTLVVNQRDYVIPEDFKKLHRLEIVNSGTVPNETVSPIIPITVNQVDLVTTGTGTPQFYYIKKNRLTLIPAPDTALTMRLKYSYQVADMTNDTDEPDVPEAYHQLIALLAAEEGFIKDGRASALLDKKLAEYKADMDTDDDERAQDLPRSIVETGSDSVGSFYW